MLPADLALRSRCQVLFVLDRTLEERALMTVAKARQWLARCSATGTEQQRATAAAAVVRVRAEFGLE